MSEQNNLLAVLTKLQMQCDWTSFQPFVPILNVLWELIIQETNPSTRFLHPCLAERNLETIACLCEDQLADLDEGSGSLQGQFKHTTFWLDRLVLIKHLDPLKRIEAFPRPRMNSAETDASPQASPVLS